jgi:predicted nucleic acid-binding protein
MSVSDREWSVSDKVFVDTNVLLYSVDSRHSVKHEQARLQMARLWESGNGRLSWQVLNEFLANAERKSGLPRTQARQYVRQLATWGPVSWSLGLLEQAWHWADTAQISYWDSLIVAAAERAGCSILLTEDLQGGREFGPIRVVNPFH